MNEIEVKIRLQLPEPKHSNQANTQQDSDIQVTVHMRCIDYTSDKKIGKLDKLIHF